MRVVTIIIYAITAPALADTLTCSTWQQHHLLFARRLREP
jgi:hypothetical protein